MHIWEIWTCAANCTLYVASALHSAEGLMLACEREDGCLKKCIIKYTRLPLKLEAKSTGWLNCQVQMLHLLRLSDVHETARQEEAISITT